MTRVSIKGFWRGIILPLLLVVCLMSLFSQPIHASTFPSFIENAEQALLYLNAQNLVDRWNNIIIKAKTGDEQLKMMRESGVFADNVKLTFDFGEKKYEFNNLYGPETRDFYNSFVNSFKKKRYNLASNVEVVDFSEDSLRFNFKHWIFFNDTLSVVGDNQAVMKRENDRYFITAADIHVIYSDTAHAY